MLSFPAPPSIKVMPDRGIAEKFSVLFAGEPAIDTLAFPPEVTDSTPVIADSPMIVPGLVACAPR